MPITLLQGQAGSGKTHFCLERLREAQRDGAAGSTLLLVPAQSAYSLRAALHTAQLPVILGQPILTFDSRSPASSLAGWLLRDRQQLWKDAFQEIEQLILLRQIRHAHPSPAVEASARTLGFQLELLRLFREWKEALLTPEELDRAFPAPQNGTASRPRDLCGLYRHYQQALTEQGRHDSEDLQQMALDHLCAHPEVVVLTHFLVDSFSHFTHWQLEVLKLLGRHAASLTVAFPYEADRPWAFEHPKNDRDALTRLLPGGATIRTLGQQHRLKTAALRRLERDLFRDRPAAIDTDGSIQWIEVADPVEELEWIARKIRLLVRDEGYHYDQIAVLFRSLAPHRRRVEEILRANGVPAYVDTRSEPLHTAPARAARQVLRLHSPRAEADDVLALFRNPLVPGLRPEADRLDLVARAEGMERASQLLEVARTRWGDGSPLASAASGLARLIADGAKRAPGRWVETIRAGLAALGAADARRGDPKLFRRHCAEWEQLEELLDHVASQMSAQPLEAEEFESDLVELLSAGRGGEMPRLAGSVFVGDVFQSRLPEVRALFLPGLVEGDFPARVMEDSLLPDPDRTRIRAATGKSLALAATRADEEYYFFYIAVTRASERLFLSRPLSDQQGRDVRASFLLREVQSIVSGLVPVRQKLGGEDYEASVGRADLDERLALALSRPREELCRPGLLKALVNARLAAGPGSPWARTPRPGQLDVLKSTRLELAATRLERFAACPFRYFAQHTLRAGDPQLLEFGPREDGTLLDEVARRYLDQLRHAGGLAKLVDAEAASTRLLEILDEILTSQHAGQLARPLWKARVGMLRAALRRFAGALLEQAQEGKWEPEYLQLAFGRARRPGEPVDPASSKEPLRLEATGLELSLDGRLDRVDRATDGSGAVRVLDYKRSPTIRIGRKLLDGRLLQIGLYRVALEQVFSRKVSSAVHFNFRKSKIQDMDQNLRDELKLEKSQPLDAAGHARAKALELGARLASGDIGVRPAPGECKGCEYDAACRIDRWRQLLGEDDEGDEDDDA